jgi:hypothetical protein
LFVIRFLNFWTSKNFKNFFKGAQENGIKAHVYLDRKWPREEDTSKGGPILRNLVLGIATYLHIHQSIHSGYPKYSLIDPL